MQASVNFTPARFNTGPDQETSIVTSTGQYIITWNFKKVKKGRLYDYHIKKYDDVIVAEGFKYGMGEDIIVTLPEHVECVRKSQLKTPLKALRSNSSIVNSPY